MENFGHISLDGSFGVFKPRLAETLEGEVVSPSHFQAKLKERVKMI